MKIEEFIKIEELLSKNINIVSFKCLEGDQIFIGKTFTIESDKYGYEYYCNEDISFFDGGGTIIKSIKTLQENQNNKIFDVNLFTETKNIFSYITKIEIIDFNKNWEF